MLLEETHYYPFGLPMHNVVNTDELHVSSRHKYQSNEYIQELGLNWMDFHARQYDPQIGRFLGIDPLADAYGQQIFSTYSAMGNAPTHMIDPNGTNARDMIIPAVAGASDPVDLGGQIQAKNNAILRDMFKYLGDAYGEGNLYGDGAGSSGLHGIVLDPMGGYTSGRSSWYSMASKFSTAPGRVEQTLKLFVLVKDRTKRTIRISMDALSDNRILTYFASIGVQYIGNGNFTQFNGLKLSGGADDSDLLEPVVELQQNGGERWLESAWNSPLARAYVPDKFTIALGAEITGILGYGVQPITISILTRGKEPVIYYTRQVNANLGGGAFFSAGVEFTKSYFSGDPRNMTASMIEGNTYGIMGTGGYLAEFSLGASFSPTDWSKKEGFINTSFGIGVGVGAFGGVQYQYTIGAIPLWQW